MLALLLSLLLQAPRTEDVRYPSGDLLLAGALLLPEATGPLPAVVVLQGSGTSDRTNAWARGIADELAANGLVVLLTDKRGCGKSQGDWRVAGIEELAADALAGVAFLRGRPEVDPGAVGLAGLSQGGWVAPVAAARSDAVAFVIDVSGCAVSYAEQTLLEMENTVRQAGFGDEAVLGVARLQRAAARYAAGGAWAEYRSALDAALETPWKEIAAGYPDHPDLPLWTFVRKMGAFDPLPAWLQVDVPVLVVYGAEDEHDNVPVAESVRRLERAFALTRAPAPTIRVIEGVGHALYDAPGHLAPEFVAGLADWIATTLAP